MQRVSRANSAASAPCGDDIPIIGTWPNWRDGLQAA
jgi:hypothetical protein